MKNKILHITLLVFVISSMTYYPSLMLSRYIHWKQVKAKLINRIPEKDLTHLMLSKQEYASLEWEHSKEFEYNHDMYDVVRQYVDNTGQIHIICLKDKEEEAIKEKFKKASKDEASDQGFLKKLKKMFDFKSETSSIVLDSGIVIGTPILNMAKPYTNLYTPTSHSIYSPPPEV